MERKGAEVMSNIVVGQNVIGRITHGLIGLDIFSREKEENQYLKDFLSLTAEEINEALTAASSGRLVPNGHSVSLQEASEIIRRILEAQEVVKRISKADEKEVEVTMKNLKKTTRMLYSIYHM